ncbi:MAG: quinone oxidoreductase family protein [Solirubrobacterales bacterium]
MLAARTFNWQDDPRVEEVPEPVAAPGESLVEVAAGYLAHFDLSVLTGEFFVVPPLPFIPGVAGAGHVLESERFPAGTPVRISGSDVGMLRDGTWAERVSVPDDGIEQLPETADLALASCFFPGLATAHAALHLVGSLAPGQRVAVTGATGAVGSLTMQVALRSGAGRVVGFHRDPAQAHLISAGAESVVWEGEDTVARFEGENAFDLVVDVVGGEVLALLATRATKRGGRVAVVGYAAADEIPITITDLIDADVSLMPVNLKHLVTAVPPARDLLTEIDDAGLEVRITTLPLSEMSEGLDLLRRGTAGGCIVLVP